jgi:hypothetical protein
MQLELLYHRAPILIPSPFRPSLPSLLFLSVFYFYLSPVSFPCRSLISTYQNTHSMSSTSVCPWQLRACLQNRLVAPTSHVAHSGGDGTQDPTLGVKEKHTAPQRQSRNKLISLTFHHLDDHITRGLCIFQIIENDVLRFHDHFFSLSVYMRFRLLCIFAERHGRS